MGNRLSEVFDKFIKNKTYIGFSRINSGHINDTFHIKTSDLSHSGYVIQRINHYVFKDIDGLMNNILLVTDHISSIYEASHEIDLERKVLKFYQSENGKYYFKDKEGYFWRCCDFIRDSMTYDLVTDLNIAFTGAELFGIFQNQLSSLDSKLIAETIPHFHDMEWRWENLMRAVEKDSVNRLGSVKKEIEFAYQRFPELDILTKKIKSGKLPLRITHNDTKFNNILFSKDGEALCVIDLDTVMPGTVLHDFGDAIRSCCNTANEDEPDLTKISFDLLIFKAFSRGYLKQASNFLTIEEKNLLVLSCRFMTFIMGIRFLADYLEGDTYYKIRHQDHNIERCRAQFRLIECMERAQTSMDKIVDDAYKMYI